MNTSSMPLLISDEEPDDREQGARLARGYAQYQRRAAIDRLITAGHVEFVENNQPPTITVRVGTMTFVDKRGGFPTERLLADIQLAIVGGETCRNNPLPLEPEDHAVEAYRYGDVYRQIAREMQARATGEIITATVKNKKGIRP